MQARNPVDSSSLPKARDVLCPLRLSWGFRGVDHRLALKREDTEDTLVDPAKRLSANKPLQSFDAESEFAQC